MLHFLFLDIMKIYKKNFSEIYVHCIHTFVLIFSFARLPKGKIKEENTLFLPSTLNQDSLIALKDHWSHFVIFYFQWLYSGSS